MSLTDKSFRDRKWNGLEQLYIHLRDKKLTDLNSSIYYSSMERLADLVNIFELANEYLVGIEIDNYELFEKIALELRRIEEEIRNFSENLSRCANRIVAIRQSITVRPIP